MSDETEVVEQGSLLNSDTEDAKEVSDAEKFFPNSDLKGDSKEELVETKEAVEEEKEEAVEEDKADSEKEEEKEEEEQEDKAPESYEDFTLPEGVELDQQLMDQFTPLAKELNLTQEQAQKLVDLQTQSLVQEQEARVKEWETQVETWQKEAKDDKEIGGKDFKENLGLAKKALDQFGNDELKSFMDYSGAGNNPEVIRFFVKLGKALNEGAIHKGGRAAQTSEDRASILYPSMQK